MCGCMALPWLWICVSSKGRLDHLKQSAEGLCLDERIGYALIDYDCPDGSADFLRKNWGARLGERLVIEELKARPYFHKAQALNHLVRHLPEGATHLVFLDADTKVTPDFLDQLLPLLDERHFVIAGPNETGLDEPDLTGFLAVARAEFEAIGGFDEDIVGYGAEDLDLRLRLHCIRALPYVECSPRLFLPLPHDDALRARYYEEKNIQRSNLRNQVLLARKLEALTGTPLSLHGASSLRLWGRFTPTGTQYELNTPDVSFELGEREALLIHFDTGRYFNTNAAGARLLAALIDGTPWDELRTQLERGTTEELVEAAREFFQALLTHELIRARTQPGARPSFSWHGDEPPELIVHRDLEDLLLLDPIHEAADAGWPLHG